MKKIPTLVISCFQLEGEKEEEKGRQSLKIRPKLKIIGGRGESWEKCETGGEELVALNRATKHAHLLRGLH